MLKKINRKWSKIVKRIRNKKNVVTIVDRSPLEPSFQPSFSSSPRKSLSPAPLWLSVFFPIPLLLCFCPNPHLALFFLLLFLTFSQNLHLLKASFPQSRKTPLPLFFASNHFLLILSKTSPIENLYPFKDPLSQFFFIPLFFFSCKLLPTLLLTLQQKGLHPQPPPWQCGNVLCHTSHTYSSYGSYPPLQQHVVQLLPGW